LFYASAPTAPKAEWLCWRRRVSLDAWERPIARRERVGRPMGVMDGWIAATAEVHALALVTRNVEDFAGAVKRVVCPWVE
jgi:predicted nucleic acid-binding protein